MSATYLYCVARSAGKPAVTRAPAGVPGATRVRAIAVTSSLWLIAADVPLEIYGGNELEKRLGDLDWVGRVAVAHDAVIDHFARRRTLTVIPMKLFTMFSSAERAVADVGARKAAIARVMRRIAGAEEWGVRITRAEAPPASRPPSRPAGTGKAFLTDRKNARDAAREARARATTIALETYDGLVRVSRAAHRRDEAPAGVAVPLLDAAFLVPVARRGVFTRVARRHAALCARAGAHMTLTGPWPAYNFVLADGPAS